MRVNIFFFCIIISLLSCVSNRKTKEPKLSQQQIEQMELALSLMKQKEFIKAGSLYDQLSVSLKTPSIKTLMLFNAGIAYKEAKECEKAFLRQKSMLDQTLKMSEFKSRALLELSYIYECLGKVEMSLLTLKDLEKFRTALPWNWNHILYPARLSLAFASMGNKLKADEYKSISLKNILEYKQKLSTKTEIQNRISQIFYLMGRSYMTKNHLKASAFLQSFFYHQLFLLQALFLQDKKWSKMAEKELDLLFDKLIFSISQIKDKAQHEKDIKTALMTGKTFVEKEKSKKWINFYNKKSSSILKLISK